MHLLLQNYSMCMVRRRGVQFSLVNKYLIYAIYAQAYEEVRTIILGVAQEHLPVQVYLYLDWITLIVLPL